MLNLCLKPVHSYLSMQSLLKYQSHLLQIRENTEKNEQIHARKGVIETVFGKMKEIPVSSDPE